MYRKIRGLKQLEQLRFPVPRYQVIAIDEDNPPNIEAYIREKIKLVEVPNKKGDSIGVTIRVSLPTELDKEGRHGGLHNVDEREILQKVLQKYKEYGPKTKIILQYTIDAKCSGAVRENGNITIETIPGDAPPLLEGKTRNIERWIYNINRNKLAKVQSFLNEEGKELDVLSSQDLDALTKYIKKAIKEASGRLYLEWSISKNGQIYFYEFGARL